MASGVSIEDIHVETAVVGLATTDWEDTEADEEFTCVRLRELKLEV